MTAIDIKVGMKVNTKTLPETENVTEIAANDIVAVASGSKLKNITYENFISPIAGGALNIGLSDTPTDGINVYNVNEAGTYVSFGGVTVTSFPEGHADYPGDMEAGIVQLRRVGTSNAFTKVIIPVDLAAYSTKVFVEEYFDDNYLNFSKITKPKPTATFVNGGAVIIPNPSDDYGEGIRVPSSQTGQGSSMYIFYDQKAVGEVGQIATIKASFTYNPAFSFFWKMILVINGSQIEINSYAVAVGSDTVSFTYPHAIATGDDNVEMVFSLATNNLAAPSQSDFGFKDVSIEVETSKNGQEQLADFIIKTVETPRPPTQNRVTVKAGGTVGVDCDFNDIRLALNSITDARKDNQYEIFLLNGTYNTSGDGYNYLSLKNWVTLNGQSKGGVKVIRREAGFNSLKVVFDTDGYGQKIEFTKIQNMTLISKGGKCPLHSDNANAMYVEAENLICINENDPGQGDETCIAVGLFQHQTFITRNCYANGVIWAHNPLSTYEGETGCRFEHYGSQCKYFTLGDLGTMGKDIAIFRGCKADKLIYRGSQNLYHPGQLPRISSWTAFLESNDFGYVLGWTEAAGGVNNETAWDDWFGGRVGLVENNIHKIVSNKTGAAITVNSLVAVSSISESWTDEIEPWTAGKKLAGVALENIPTGDCGLIQFAGVLRLMATGTIEIGDELELNASGIIAKRTTGYLVGTAKQARSGANSVIPINVK